MTRETRIGMVVGLLFIIAFGLVLSELTGTPSTPSETLATNSEEPDRSPVPVSTERPISAARRPLAAETESTSRQQRSSEPQQQPSESQRQAQQQPEQAQQDTAEEASSEPSRTEQSQQQSPRPRTYTVSSGDTLTGIAERFYGSGGGRHYRRILEANSDRISSAESISVGQELIIPPPPGEESSDRTSMSLDELRRRFGAADTNDTADEPSDSDAQTYTVRPGDNLTRIARQFYGDGGREAVMKIYKANQDVLSTPDALPAGAELKIPR